MDKYIVLKAITDILSENSDLPLSIFNGNSIKYYSILEHYDNIIKNYACNSCVLHDSLINWSGTKEDYIYREFTNLLNNEKFYVEMDRFYTNILSDIFYVKTNYDPVIIRISRNKDVFFRIYELINICVYMKSVVDSKLQIKSGLTYKLYSNTLYINIIISKTKDAGNYMYNMIGPVFSGEIVRYSTDIFDNYISSSFMSSYYPFTIDELKRRKKLISRTLRIVYYNIDYIYIHDDVIRAAAFLVDSAYTCSFLVEDRGINNNNHIIYENNDLSDIVITYRNNNLDLSLTPYTGTKHDKGLNNILKRKLSEIRRRRLQRRMLLLAQEVIRINMIAPETYANVDFTEDRLNHLFAIVCENICSSIYKHLLCETIIISRIHYSKANKSVSKMLLPMKSFHQGKFIVNENFSTQDFSKKTSSYLAVKFGDVISLGTGNTIFDTSEAGAYFLHQSLLKEAEYKSVIAVPIRFNNRIWGVIEVASRYENAFDAISINFVMQISDIIAHDFHQAYITYIIEKLNIIFATDENIASLIADMFLCESVVVWTPKTDSGSWFRASSFHNRDKIDYTSQFNSAELAHVASQMIKEKERWFSGKIGDYPLDEKWLETEHGRSLRNFTTLGLIVIYNDDGIPKIIISLASKKGEFSSYFKGLAYEISSHLARKYNISLIEKKFQESAGNFSHIFRDTKNACLHEIKKMSGRLKDRLYPYHDKDRYEIDSLLEEVKWYRSNYGDIVDKSSKIIDNQLSDLGYIYSILYSLDEKHDGNKSCNLSELIDVCVSKFKSEATRAGVIVRTLIPENCYVAHKSIVIITLLNPAIDNAIKYTQLIDNLNDREDLTGKRVINIKAASDNKNRLITVDIQNHSLATGLSKDDIIRYGTRGKNTIRNLTGESKIDVGGQGYGCNIINKIAKKSSIEVDIQEHQVTNSALVTFNVRFVFRLL